MDPWSPNCHQLLSDILSPGFLPHVHSGNSGCYLVTVSSSVILQIMYILFWPDFRQRKIWSHIKLFCLPNWTWITNHIWVIWESMLKKIWALRKKGKWKAFKYTAIFNENSDIHIGRVFYILFATYYIFPTSNKFLHGDNLVYQ